MKRILKLVCASLVVFLPLIVQAITFENPLQWNNFQELTDALTNYLYYLALAVVPLSIGMGAFYILTSAGDDKRIKTGRSFIIWACVGLLVILFSKGLIAAVQGILGG